MGCHGFLRKAKSERLGTAVKHGSRDVLGNAAPILHGTKEKVRISRAASLHALVRGVFHILVQGVFLDSSQVSELRK